MAAVLALLIAGLQGVAIRSFVLRSPNQTPVAALHPSQSVCEGPVAGHGPSEGIAVWGAALSPTARLTLTAQDAATHRSLGSGSVTAFADEDRWAAGLGHGVPGGRPLRICVTDSSGIFSLAGSGAVNPAVVMTGAGSGQEFSLALLSGERSLFSTLPTAFSRASLWRPSWVGSWTFWVLLIGVAATFALGVMAVTRAADEDAERSGDDRGSPRA
ncbi:MAG: hypothetical protein ACRDNS_04270 [Trebonia sp.]